MVDDIIGKHFSTGNLLYAICNILYLMSTLNQRHDKLQQMNDLLCCQEERFLFPIYPLFCMAAAVTLDHAQVRHHVVDATYWIYGAGQGGNSCFR